MARPEITIDWKKADDLMIAGCSGIEIAAHLGINKMTFYERVEKQKGMSYQDYLATMRSKGDALLKAQQFAKALGITKNGDNMMLIWLGKNRLDQSDQRQQDNSSNEQVISGTLDLAKLKAENAELKRLLNESKTGIEHLPSEQTSEHMVRSSSVGQDLQ